MAVAAEAQSKVFRLRINLGSDYSGNPIFKSNSFKTKFSAADNDIYDIALALHSLRTGVLVGIYKEETYELIEE
ncbi:DUF1659 domain-containing protein [Desulforamulus aquiferis]|uniref:DUF1659 domain-containing protein n=1 Tax=Desulforamulus aquiferis TaxID=1397668 RepID=A0AAW7ZDP0_9FIRM|nr:DUF1659 domain-containing protein [Desulforamulus aquiferis]MDO7787879.1 DUF1659 domain-containing protein [Desulforamulus aquiferis]